MAFAHASYVDARYSTFNDVGRDQYNMVFSQYLSHKPGQANT
jgi:hypothetical protein